MPSRRHCRRKPHARLLTVFDISAIMILCYAHTMNYAGRPAYTLDEAAQLLGVSRATIGRLVRAGKLRVARIGQRTVRVTDEALRDFLRDHETTGKESYPYRHGSMEEEIHE